MSETMPPGDLRAEVLAWLSEQERLCAAATPGPWTARVLGTGKRTTVWIEGRPKAVSENAIVAWNGFDSSSTSRPVQAKNARLIAASRTVLPLALAALRAEVEAHDPWGIYDECGHDHGRDYDNMDPKVHDIEDVGLVCDDGLVQRVCRVCHLTNDEPRDDTSDAEWPCPTIQRIHAATVGHKARVSPAVLS